MWKWLRLGWKGRDQKPGITKDALRTLPPDEIAGLFVEVFGDRMVIYNARVYRSRDPLFQFTPGDIVLHSEFDSISVEKSRRADTALLMYWASL